MQVHVVIAVMDSQDLAMNVINSRQLSRLMKVSMQASRVKNDRRLYVITRTPPLVFTSPHPAHLCFSSPSHGPLPPHHPPTSLTMSRATRFLALVIPLTTLYLLALLGVLPVPLIDTSKARLLLPVVCPLFPCSTTLADLFGRGGIDPMVVPRFVWCILAWKSRDGASQVPGLSRGIQ